MKNRLKPPVPLIPLLIFLTLLFLMTGPRMIYASDQVIDSVAAVVNQNVITQNQLDLALADVEKNIRANGQPVPPLETLRKTVLDQLINARLQLQAAKDSGITADEADIDKAAEQVARQNNLSTEQLYTKIKAQGMDVARWRKEIHDQLLIQKIQQQEVGGSITLTQEEVDAFTRSLPPPDLGPKEYHLRDFLIALPEDSSPKVMAASQRQANLLAHQLRQKNKIDVSNITISDRGWESLTDMPEAFAHALAQHKNQGFIGPIQTGNGFHIIHVVDARYTKKAPPPPSAADIRKQLFEQKYQKAVTQWIALLRSRGTLNIHTNNPT